MNLPWHVLWFRGQIAVVARLMDRCAGANELGGGAEGGGRSVDDDHVATSDHTLR